MDDEEGEGPPRAAAGHIKKRALKNNALSISFNDKDLRYTISCDSLWRPASSLLFSSLPVRVSSAYETLE